MWWRQSLRFGRSYPGAGTTLWILATHVWNDSGAWIDTANWED